LSKVAGCTGTGIEKFAGHFSVDLFLKFFSVC